MVEQPVEEYKIVVLGAGAVGKSCLTIRFTSGKFLEQYSPTIEETFKKKLKVDNSLASLHILDTAGMESYSTLQEGWMREGKGFIIMYDVTNTTSFEEIKQTRVKIQRTKNRDDVPMVIVGNKIDKEDQRKVTAEEANQLATSWNVKHFETSAKNKINIKEPFEEVVRAIRIQDENDKKKSKTNKKKNSKNSWCNLL